MNMTNPIEINLNSATFEVLMQHVRDGVEATAGTWFMPWRARQEAIASKIYAESKADEFRIVSKGQRDALGTLLAESFGADLTVELRSDTEGPLLTVQGQKRFRNVCNTVIGAAQELEGVEVRNHAPNLDFIARFFGDVQDVSSELKLQITMV